MWKRKKEKSIFRMILVPLIGVLTIEMVLLLGSLILGGVISKLNQNAQDILLKQVENRGNYLLNDMIGKWGNLNLLEEQVNNTVQRKLDAREITLEGLNSSDDSAELLDELRSELISTMYNKQVSGIFLILNSKGLEAEDDRASLPGIYLRDLDPTSAAPTRNEDILVERAPTSVVRSGYIATDTGWQPAFSYEDSMAQPFFFKPYLAAWEDGGSMESSVYGYWTTEAYSLSGDNRKSIAYSIPLILEDGTVYGVLGVELLTDYLQSLLPCSELAENGQGSYLLGYLDGEDEKLKPVFLSSESVTEGMLEGLEFSLSESDLPQFWDEEGNYLGEAQRLLLYSRNAPFDSDQWYITGFCRKEHLFAFSRQVQRILALAFLLTAMVGLAGIFVVSFTLSKPVQMLSREVEGAMEKNVLPILPDTKIQEIDQFSHAIIQLEQKVMDSSARFMQIIGMASVALAGYEIREGTSDIFVTDNYFPLLGAEDVNVEGLTAEEFLKKREELQNSLKHSKAEDGSIVYAVPQKGGGVRYLRAESSRNKDRIVGLIEDVTTSTLERMKIERERDCDGLTKLYSRRGFRRVADDLFLHPEELGEGALLMIDLDNLKTTNDRFGHNFGDLYIQTAGRCFLENTPDSTLCARISGDEFVLLFYGYDSPDEIRDNLKKLYDAIHEVEFTLPNGEHMGLSASGGVAWYPKDSRDVSELMKFADFAMYQVKHSKKGGLIEFDKEAYEEKMEQNQNRLEFHQLLESRQLHYHYQPIFDAKKGEVYAYEALMRVNMPTLRSPETVLSLAKEEGRMRDIEYLTMFCASRRYMELLEEHKVSENALLFINSIANVRMSEEEEKEYHDSFEKLQPKIVIEITEAESLDMEILRRKEKVEGFLGRFALDDYGSGYNSEINLLELNPEFVKVDISIVRDVDKDVNKQQIVSNIVEYAHKRGMKVIMEGLETAEELKKSLELGVDLLQGYFLARPGEVPPELSKEARGILKKNEKLTKL